MENQKQFVGCGRKELTGQSKPGAGRPRATCPEILHSPASLPPQSQLLKHSRKCPNVPEKRLCLSPRGHLLIATVQQANVMKKTVTTKVMGIPRCCNSTESTVPTFSWATLPDMGKAKHLLMENSTLCVTF